MTTSPHHTWTEGPAIHCILPLGENSHKGSSGRIGILGGSARYTGAPYYAGIASLQTGADLAYVFCADEAALAIKSYSPELMVAPVYNAKEFDDQVEQWGSSTDIPEGARQLKSNMVARVAEMLPRLHCLVIGPGMGRCPLVISAVADIIEEAKKHDLQLVLDADALYMLSLEPYRGILTNYRRAVLTPNAVEFKRLFPDDSTYDTALDSVIIVKKGRTDMVSLGPTKPLFECRERGGLKRSGGIGDILSGTIGTLAAWQILMKQDESLGMACWTACCAVKRATASAFESKQRSMTAPDVLNELGATFTKMTED